ncbi:hypothetical protein NXY56_000515 [Leishmania guyanensis]
MSSPEVVPLRPVSGASDARCETRPVPRPLPIPPPLRMLPPPEERLPCEKRVTPTRAHKRVTWASDVPATDEACPAPEVVPLRPVSGASDARCGSRRGSRPLCGCKKQRTDRESRLSGALLRLYSRAGLSAAEIRFRVRQRRELGIERFRRVGLCTEESDAGTLQPGDVLPRTDADTASDVASNAATLPPGDVLPRTDADTASGVASNAATLPPGDVLPRTDADTASGVASNAATLPPGDVLPRTDTATAVGLASAVGQPIPLRPVSGPSGTRCGRSRGSRPLCGCKKQRTDREIRLSGVLLGLYSRAGFSAAEIRFRVRQRRELGIERFRRVGLCTEESDAGTLQPGDVLPRTDADTASDVASNAATLPPGDVLPRTDADASVASMQRRCRRRRAPTHGHDYRSWFGLCGGPANSAAAGEWPLWHPMREKSRQPPLCGCKKQRTDREIRLSGVLLGLYSRAVSLLLKSASECARTELGIERFRRVGLCTEESDAGRFSRATCSHARTRLPQLVWPLRWASQFRCGR